MGIGEAGHQCQGILVGIESLVPILLLLVDVTSGKVQRGIAGIGGNQLAQDGLGILILLVRNQFAGVGEAGQAVASILTYTGVRAGSRTLGRRSLWPTGKLTRGTRSDNVEFAARRRQRRIVMLEGLFQPMHLLVIFFIALLVFGPKKLPELGKGIGEGIRALKEGMKDSSTEQAKAPGADAKSTGSADASNRPS